MILAGAARIIAAAAMNGAGDAINIAGEFTGRFKSCMNGRLKRVLPAPEHSEKG
jgi:hypothetical protein